ncbi:MAG: type II secretion system F family protein [Candidatus Firestonebacteria bacterium]
MALFSYKAKSLTGAVVTGTMDAESERVLAAKLRGQKITLLSASLEKKKGFRLPFFKGSKVTIKDLSVFCRQFSTMISAGVPVLQSLNIIHDQVENKTLKEVVAKIRDDIGGGSTLTDALAKHPNVFSNLFVNMVKAGEAAGILDGILQRLSGYLEKADSLKRKVKSAMMYPMVVSSIAIAVTVFLMVFVIPTFKTVFESFGKELPLPTKILLAISDIMREVFLPPQIFIEIVVIIGGIIALKKFLNTKKGKLMWNSIQLKLPMFGILIKKVAIAKFARTLGTLIKSGVPILEALDITAKTAGNLVIEEAIMKVRSSIKEGENITEPLKASGIFPPMVTQMVSVGEETGTIDDMLVKSADFYDDEVDTAISGLTSMIEPLLIAFMGVVIGSIVIAMFMPMFELGSVVE